MSVEVTGWAFRQKVPPKPKMVLMALADQTDEKTGRVCYGKTDMSHLAEKASVPERSLYRYINALMRNGYLIRESGKEKGHPNAYWLRLDRALAESLSDWKWAVDPSDEDEDGEPLDVAEGSATMADPPDVENCTEGLPVNGRGGLPYVADQDSPELPKNVNARARGASTRSFSSEAQDIDRERTAISKTANQAGARYFVLEGSRAWIAWLTYRREVQRLPVWTLPTCYGTDEFSNRRGWFMPSLFPPSSTDPPNTS